MICATRTYQIVNSSPVSTSDLSALAHQLVYGTWTCCSAFRLGPLLIVNNSCSESEPQEYAVFKLDDEAAYREGTIEAIPIARIIVSIMTVQQAYDTLKTLLHDPTTMLNSSTVGLHLEHKRHRCPFCT